MNLRMPAIVCFVAGCLGTSPLSAQEQTVAYADDFSSVEGQQTSNMNGFYEDSSDTKTRYTFSYLNESVAGGDLVISILEDDETKGPDGKPGVLSMTYEDVPENADYSGFVYLGLTNQPIKLPNFQGNAGKEDLQKVKVSFQYKAANSRKERVGASYNCRFEVDIEEAFLYRVDFGELKATGQWSKFESTLGRGTNGDMFLKAVNANPGKAFKIVWGQEGAITNYDNNDTLLIDDIKITVTK